MMRQVDAYFICLCGAGNGPSPESLLRLRLVRNMTLSYGLTVYLPDDSCSVAESTSLEDAAVIVAFLVSGTQASDEPGTGATPISYSHSFTPAKGAVSKGTHLDFVTLGMPENRVKLLPVALDVSMLDRGLWGEEIAGLLGEHLEPLDMTGDFDDTPYLSASIARLCSAIGVRIETPSARNPIRGISLDAPYVPSAYRRRSMLSSPALLAQTVDVRPEDVPTAELLPRIFAMLGGGEWINQGNWCSEQPWDTWHGLSVIDGLVTKVSLPRNGLKGTSISIATFITVDLRGASPGALGVARSSCSQPHFQSHHRNDSKRDFTAAISSFTLLDKQ